MRINTYIAQATGVSRRGADKLISEGKVSVDGKIASLGQVIDEDSQVVVDGETVSTPQSTTLIMLNKPLGYVVSRLGQGAKTIYELVPPKYAKLKPIGRLDKDSTGLLLMTDDGKLAQELSHPSANKQKTYLITLDRPLAVKHQEFIERGVKLEDGLSRLGLSKFSQDKKSMTVKMTEGRNRQIRRTFAALNYKVVSLHRIGFGEYQLNGLASGKIQLLKK